MANLDLNYYQGRVAEELAAAGRASCPQAAEAHRQMAELYLLIYEEAAAVAAAKVVRLPARSHRRFEAAEADASAPDPSSASQV